MHKYNIKVDKNEKTPISVEKFHRVIRNARDHRYAVLVYDSETGRLVREIDGVQLPSIKEAVTFAVERHERKKNGERPNAGDRQTAHVTLP